MVEGLEHGRLAIVPKVHHAIIDGVSGAQVMAAFFDLSPVPAPVPLFGRPAGPRPGGHAVPPGAAMRPWGATASRPSDGTGPPLVTRSPAR